MYIKFIENNAYFTSSDTKTRLCKRKKGLEIPSLNLKLKKK